MVRGCDTSFVGGNQCCREHVLNMLVATYKTTCINAILRVGVLPLRWRQYVSPNWLPRGITSHNYTFL